MFGTMTEGINHKILALAEKLFVERGVHDVTIDDVCRKLSISKKTFYQIYPQKENLVDEVIKFQLRRDNAYFNSLLNDKNPIEMIKTISTEIKKNKAMGLKYKRFHCDVAKYYPETFAQNERLKYSSMKVQLASYIEKGQTEGFFRTEINPHAFILIVSMAVKDTVAYMNGDKTLTENYGKSRISKKAFGDTLFDFIYNSLLTPKGWEEYHKNQQ